MDLPRPLSILGNHGTVTLSDGRELGYARFGPSGRQPICAFGGTPGSRWFGAFFHDVAHRLDRSILAFERPGCGLSDPLPDRSLADWARDVEDAATTLGIEEFGILAFSAGGPHALACGVEIPDRVTAIALASPAGPPSTFANQTHRRALWLARNAPWLLSPLLSVIAGLSRRASPEKIATDYLGTDVLDVEVGGDATAAQVAYADVLGAVEAGTDGVLSELRTLATPWEIDPADVAVPVECWHSDTDADVPIKVARDLCETIPDARLHVRTDEHHGEVLVRCREQLVTASAASQGSGGSPS